jgi:hypothetical protein
MSGAACERGNVRLLIEERLGDLELRIPVSSGSAPFPTNPHIVLNARAAIPPKVVCFRQRLRTGDVQLGKLTVDCK